MKMGVWGLAPGFFFQDHALQNVEKHLFMRINNLYMAHLPLKRSQFSFRKTAFVYEADDNIYKWISLYGIFGQHKALSVQTKDELSLEEFYIKGSRLRNSSGLKLAAPSGKHQNI